MQTNKQTIPKQGTWCETNYISGIYLIGEAAGQMPISKPGKSFHTSFMEMQMLNFPIETH